MSPTPGIFGDRWKPMSIPIRCQGSDRLPMPTLPPVTEGASGTATMPTVLADSQSMLVDGGRCSRRQPRNRLIPRFNRVANLFWIHFCLIFHQYFQLFVSWQPRNRPIPRLTSVSSTNVGCIGHHRLPSGTLFSPSAKTSLVDI